MLSARTHADQIELYDKLQDQKNADVQQYNQIRDHHVEKVQVYQQGYQTLRGKPGVSPAVESTFDSAVFLGITVSQQ